MQPPAVSRTRRCGRPGARAGEREREREQRGATRVASTQYVGVILRADPEARRDRFKFLLESRAACSLGARWNITHIAHPCAKRKTWHRKKIVSRVRRTTGTRGAPRRRRRRHRAINRSCRGLGLPVEGRVETVATRKRAAIVAALCRRNIQTKDDSPSYAGGCNYSQGQRNDCRMSGGGAPPAALSRRRRRRAACHRECQCQWQCHSLNSFLSLSRPSFLLQARSRSSRLGSSCVCSYNRGVLSVSHGSPRIFIPCALVCFACAGAARAASVRA